jgi:hypothetical protein
MNQLNECVTFVRFPLKPNSKEPKVKGWNTRTPDDLMREFVEGDNIGLRIEPPLFVVDVDDRRLAALIEEDFPKTLTVVTPRGFHYYFVASNIYPQTNKQSGLIQLLSKGCYVVEPPSKVDGHEYHYLDPNTPIAALDGKAIEKLERMLRALGKYENLIRGFAAFWTEGHRHNLSLWLNGALRKAGLERFEAAVVVKSICLLADDGELRDRLEALKTTYEKDIEEIAGWSRLETELQAIVELDKARELLSLLPRPKKNEEHAEVPGEKPRGNSVLSLSLPKLGLVLEAVGVPNDLNSYDPKLLVLGPQGFETHDWLLVDGVELRPRSPRSYPYEPYVVENFTVKKKSELVDLVRAEVDKFVDAEPEEKAIFTGLIVLSYCQELFETLPYLYLVGDNSSGKSHLLQLFYHLCYRPLYGVSLTHADIYSYLEDDGLPLTILEDEFQGSENDNDKMKIYKAGYKKRTPVPRVTIYEGGRRVDYFNSFGLKIVASEQLVENKGFLERCLVVEMVEGYPEKDHYDGEDLKRFTWLRSELLKWRMYVLAGREIMPKLEFDWLKGRDREIYLPLLTVLEGTALYPLLERTLLNRVEERKKEKAASLEASVCRVVKRLMDDGKELAFADIWNELANDIGASFEYRPGSQISDAMNSDAYGRITKKRLSNILRDKLGMTPQRLTRGGKKVVIYKPNPTKLSRALRKYIIPDKLPDGHDGHGKVEAKPLENPVKTP